MAGATEDLLNPDLFGRVFVLRDILFSSFRGFFFGPAGAEDPMISLIPVFHIPEVHSYLSPLCNGVPITSLFTGQLSHTHG